MVKKRYLYVLAVLLPLGIASTVFAGEGGIEGMWSSSLQRFSLRQTGLSAAIAAQEPKKAVRMGAEMESDTPSKSRGRAFFQSLILPGWGQYYAESRTMMKVFAVSEVITWGSYFGFRTWSNWLEDDYRTFAATHAGVATAGKPGNYFVDIGRFADIFEYNQAQLRDRDVADLYSENQEFFWRWDSESNRRRYDDLRKRSDRASNRSDFAIAAVVVNHLVSAIQSTLAVYHYNKRAGASKLGFDFEMQQTDVDTRVALSVKRHF